MGNVLIISGGIFIVICVLVMVCIYIMVKLLLIGLFGSVNMGGFFVFEMVWVGFYYLVIIGKVELFVYFFIYNNIVEIRDVGYLWGCMIIDI